MDIVQNLVCWCSSILNIRGSQHVVLDTRRVPATLCSGMVHHQHHQVTVKPPSVNSQQNATHDVTTSIAAQPLVRVQQKGHHLILRLHKSLLVAGVPHCHGQPDLVHTELLYLTIDLLGVQISSSDGCKERKIKRDQENDVSNNILKI